MGGSIKEKLCVLAKTYPTVSKKYEHLVCVGGFTSEGKWRRVYPVPWDVFWKSDSKFKKKSWIEYEKQSDDPSDHRSESRKIKPETIAGQKDATFKEIKQFLDSRLTTLEELGNVDHHEVSMGVIKPYKILDLVAEPNEHLGKNEKRKAQTNLFGRSVVQVDIPKNMFSYEFLCSPSCKGHKMMCEDWELLALYRNCEEYLKKGKYGDEAEVIEKVKQRFLSDMVKKKDVYFLVGTHYRFNTYIVIGVIYPKKDDKY